MATNFSLNIYREVEPPRECSYLPRETAALEYRIPLTLGADQYAALLARGWRRFGDVLFRPQCPRCRKCQSLRVIVSLYQLSKSDRRNLRRNADIEVTIGSPEASPAHVELFNAWHRDMQLRRDWPLNETTIDSYHSSFIGRGFEFAREFQYRRDGKLIGVGLVDETPIGLSSIYFYHDPDWRKLGPGTFSALCELDYAVQLGLPHLYLGYWIAECPSMTYKATFHPHELLEQYVEDDDEPVWCKVSTDASS